MNQKLSRKINNLENIDRIPAEELFQYIPLNKEDKLVDLGAGAGYISLPISTYVDEVTALDFDEEILMYLETKASEKGISNIQTIASDFKDIKLENEKFDKAIASISLHEAQPLSLVLNEIYRILKKNGMFLCIELEKSSQSTGPRVSSKEMKQELLHAGFEILDISFPQIEVAKQAVYIIVAQKK